MIEPPWLDAAGGLALSWHAAAELDELLVQLVDWAGDVLTAQGRLRGLRVRPRRALGAIRARSRGRRPDSGDRRPPVGHGILAGGQDVPVR
jgi:hypothetical protein